MVEEKKCKFEHSLSILFRREGNRHDGQHTKECTASLEQLEETARTNRPHLHETDTAPEPLALTDDQWRMIEWVKQHVENSTANM